MAPGGAATLKPEECGNLPPSGGVSQWVRSGTESFTSWADVPSAPKTWPKPLKLSLHSDQPVLCLISTSLAQQKEHQLTTSARPEAYLASLKVHSSLSHIRLPTEDYSKNATAANARVQLELGENQDAVR